MCIDKIQMALYLHAILPLMMNPSERQGKLT